MLASLLSRLPILVLIVLSSFNFAISQDKIPKCKEVMDRNFYNTDFENFCSSLDCCIFCGEYEAIKDGSRWIVKLVDECSPEGGFEIYQLDDDSIWSDDQGQIFDYDAKYFDESDDSYEILICPCKMNSGSYSALISFDKDYGKVKIL